MPGAIDLLGVAANVGLSQKENLRVQRLKSGLGTLQEQVAAGELHPEEGEFLATQIGQQLEPLQRRQQASAEAAQKAQEMQLAEAGVQASQAASYQANAKAANVPHQIQELLNPHSGQMEYYFVPEDGKPPVPMFQGGPEMPTEGGGGGGGTATTPAPQGQQPATQLTQEQVFNLHTASRNTFPDPAPDAPQSEWQRTNQLRNWWVQQQMGQIQANLPAPPDRGLTAFQRENLALQRQRLTQQGGGHGYQGPTFAYQGGQFLFRDPQTGTFGPRQPTTGDQPAPAGVVPTTPMPTQVRRPGVQNGTPAGPATQQSAAQPYQQQGPPRPDQQTPQTMPTGITFNPFTNRVPTTFPNGGGNYTERDVERFFENNGLAVHSLPQAANGDWNRDHWSSLSRQQTSLVNQGRFQAASYLGVIARLVQQHGSEQAVSQSPDSQAYWAAVQAYAAASDGPPDRPPASTQPTTRVNSGPNAGMNPVVGTTGGGQIPAPQPRPVSFWDYFSF